MKCTPFAYLSKMSAIRYITQYTVDCCFIKSDHLLFAFIHHKSWSVTVHDKYCHDMMRCHLAAELRTFSRSPEIGTRMGGRQENRSSRWSVPLAVVLLATASCHSLGLSLGLSSPLSQQSKTYFHFRFVAFHGLLVTQHLHVQNCNARRIMMSILQSCTSLSRPGKE